MNITIRAYTPDDLPAMTALWNDVVADGVAFPQEDRLTADSGERFFASQTHCGVAEDATGAVLGLYILHPNNVGRCGHICNASYAVQKTARGQGVGRALVLDSLAQGKAHGFRVMQFNAVVAENRGARRLYEALGFTQLGVIPGGFRMPDGRYEDICPYYKVLSGY
ncbi:MAG: GNAT family N-acetyltransferase [Clostridia bacterium]|nr:GNAT family N-acetyltransferase [Clostridia bacterium]